jgi:Chlorophyllase enzyme
MNKQFPAEGLVLLDPVDSDPVNSTKPVVVPEITTGMKSPMLIVTSGLGGVSGLTVGGLVAPPCCPVGESGDKFYAGFDTSKYLLNATIYGHADILSTLI